MTDAWRALPRGGDAVMHVLPTTFNWPLFLVALLLIASPLLHRLVLSDRRRAPRPNAESAG